MARNGSVTPTRTRTQKEANTTAQMRKYVRRAIQGEGRGGGKEEGRGEPIEGQQDTHARASCSARDKGGRTRGGEAGGTAGERGGGAGRAGELERGQHNPVGTYLRVTEHPREGAGKGRSGLWTGKSARTVKRLRAWTIL